MGASRAGDSFDNEEEDEVMSSDNEGGVDDEGDEEPSEGAGDGEDRDDDNDIGQEEEMSDDDEDEDEDEDGDQDRNENENDVSRLTNDYDLDGESELGDDDDDEDEDDGKNPFQRANSADDDEDDEPDQPQGAPPSDEELDSDVDEDASEDDYSNEDTNKHKHNQLSVSGKPLSMLKGIAVDSEKDSDEDDVDDDNGDDGTEQVKAGIQDAQDDSNDEEDDSNDNDDDSQDGDTEADEVTSEAVVVEAVPYDECAEGELVPVVAAVEVVEGDHSRKLKSGKNFSNNEPTAVVQAVVVEGRREGKRKRQKTKIYEAAPAAPVTKLKKTQMSTTPLVTKSSSYKKNKSIPENKRLTKQEQANHRRKIKAAQEAREFLKDSVPQIPISIQGILVRKMGVIYVDPPDVAKVEAGGVKAIGLQVKEEKYSNARALHPVGYSADWFVHSPVHNRAIQCRCDILRGMSGPLFRVRWGKGLDQTDAASAVTALVNAPNGANLIGPFEIDKATPVLLGDSFQSLSKKKKSSNHYFDNHDGHGNWRKPEIGMRIRVKFEGDEAGWYEGTVVGVILNKSPNSSSEDSKTSFTLQIEYDNGEVEEETYPGEGIRLFTDEELLSQLMTDPDGSPAFKPSNGIYTVYGKSPLEAWGKVLTQLGLIDEIIADHAFDALINVRKKSLDQAKERLKNLQLQRKHAKMRHKQRQLGKDVNRGEPIEDDNMQHTHEDCESEQDEGDTMKRQRSDSVSMMDETALQQKLNSLLEKYDQMKAEADASKARLCSARLNALGPFLTNPFLDASMKQQENWLTAVIRKEKAKMGSTGNKRKILNSADLLNRMDTFFNPEIERLVEGLPGSELCPNYVFKACRGAGGSVATTQAWVQEAHIKAEKERDRQRKVAKEMKLKEKEEKEREEKRKLREKEVEQRKQQKLEEEQEKKKARQEERLSRLAVQVDERLFKEAIFQREKVVVIAQKSVVKEYLRRRNAAEKVAAYVVEQGFLDEETEAESHGRVLPEFRIALPPLAKKYDKQVLRIWDFLCSFKSALKTAEIETFPDLDTIQDAISTLREVPPDPTVDLDNLVRRREAVILLTTVAMTFCRPLSVGLTKILSSAVGSSAPVSAVPARNPMDAEADSDSEEAEMNVLVDLPVTESTWMDVARLAILADALMEGLLFNKVDCANVLRGYRSGGHPNSKEAQRLRRGEDASIGKLRQAMAEKSGSLFPGLEKDTLDKHNGVLTVTVSVPTVPSSTSDDWLFYLHNVKALPASAPGANAALRENLQKSLTILTDSSLSMTDEEKENFVSELGQIIKILEGAGTEIERNNKAGRAVLKLLDIATGELFSSQRFGQPFHKELQKAPISEAFIKTKSQTATVGRTPRLRAGIVDQFMITRTEYTKMMIEREEYMAAALKKQLKREHQALKKENAGKGDDEEEEDDDDDDASDDEEEDNEIESKPKSNESKQTLKKEGTDVQMKIANEVGAEAKEEAFKDPNLIGKTTPFDSFCGDNITYPESIRRCLAVVRSLCMSPPGETFIYPVDPQANPRYYETVTRPISLQDVGESLMKDGRRLSRDPSSLPTEEQIVAQFARDVRLIAKNCISYSSIGSALISYAEQLMRIFERLLIDWVLSPTDLLTKLEDLDDDKCVDHHPSDMTSMILICDSCEGKFNMSRLEPTLTQVPKGDWFCPRCVSGRCWAHIDPRVGRQIKRIFEGKEHQGKVIRVHSAFTENGFGRSSLLYTVKYENGLSETWTLKEVNEALSIMGQVLPEVRYEEALAECLGYGSGHDFGIGESVPVFLDPKVSDTAAQAMLSSNVFRQSVRCVATLGICGPEELKAEEWISLLTSLMMKCALSESIQEASSRMETEAAAKLNRKISSMGKSKTVEEVLPKISEDESDCEEVSPEDLVELTVPKEEPESLKDCKLSPKTFEASIKPRIGKRKRKDVLFGDEDSSEDDVEHDGEEDPDDEADSRFAKKQKVEANDLSPLSPEPDVTKSGSQRNMVGVSSILIADQVLPDAVPSEMETYKKMRKAAFSKKVQRAKAREDNFVALSLKTQLRPALASFEEDTFSPVIDSMLSSQVEGLDLDSCLRPKEVCDLCSLSDIALGSTLFRVPNRDEWVELMANQFRNRAVRMIAEVSAPKHVPAEIVTVDPEGDFGVVVKSRLVGVSVRVGGNLVSDDEDVQSFVDLAAYGMLELIPRNPVGAQDELKFRADNGLSFVTGSLSAHECCALAAQNARKDKLLKSHKEKMEASAERDFGRLCGKTLPLGTDVVGRTYWKFLGDTSSLFVCCVENNSDGQNQSGTTNWWRYKEPESIASVIVCLGTSELATDLKRHFPQARKLIKGGQWSAILQQKKYADIFKNRESDDVLTKNDMASVDKTTNKSENKESKGNTDSATNGVELIPADQMPYEEGEDILVESCSGHLLWDAVVVAVSREKDSENVNGYRVHYKQWSTRFDEWVSSDRVVEPSNHNLEVQEELLDERISARESVPEALKYLLATKYLHSRRRAKGATFLSASLSDSLSVGVGATCDEMITAILKASLLLIEAALPVGSVNTSEKGPWNPEASNFWRSMVRFSIGPATLMGCVILLQDAIDKGWYRPRGKHMMECLPMYWKAIEDATLASIATRIWILDRSILYGMVNNRPSTTSKGRKSK